MKLSDIDKVKIEAFCADKKMYNAVKNVLLAGIYSHGVVEAGHEHDPLVNGAFSLVAHATNNPIPDEIIGQQLRAQWAGINALKNGFDKLDSTVSKKPELIKTKVNIAE